MSSVTIVNCCGDSVAFQLKLWEVPVPGRRRPLDRGTGTITGQIPMGFLAGEFCHSARRAHFAGFRPEKTNGVRYGVACLTNPKKA